VEVHRVGVDGIRPDADETRQRALLLLGPLALCHDLLDEVFPLIADHKKWLLWRVKARQVKSGVLDGGEGVVVVHVSSSGFS